MRNEQNNTEGKESKININMRVKESLRTKIKEQMDMENKTPDEMFSEMFYSYIKQQAENKGEADYSSDITELNNVVKRTVTIFQNMIEKTYMQNAITKENFNNQIKETTEKIKSEYEDKIKILEKEVSKYKKEYDLISEQAEALIKDTRALKETSSTLKSANEKNEELIKTYKEQIEALKISNEALSVKAENLIDSSLLEKAEIEKGKALLEKDNYYQKIINEMQSNYNELQSKYTLLLESSFIKDTK